ncbi:metallophosphoesterase family protein [Terrabacter carboxydivorans]|uniref:Metallophosphoesterase family protein n=1 Tax=Terrabacter carboxydivorans TaxID=619730 RepID=A0ABP5Z5A5_9MICO
MTLALDRIAVISDVHGNVTALEAVLADIEARGITRILNLGDVVGKGPRGSEAIKRTRDSCEVTVRGNWDTLIGDWEGFVDRGDVPRFDAGQWTRDEITDEDAAWLLGLPNAYDLVLSGKRIRLFHASQTSEFVRVRAAHTMDEFRGMFTNTDFTGPWAPAVPGHPDDTWPDDTWPAGTTPDVVGYGDIHGAYLEADEGLVLFNAGAVGNHLDGPSAPYCILEGVTDSLVPQSFSVNFVRVPYDIESEIDAARDLGMPDVDAYALELRDQVYRGAGRPA